MSKRKQKQRARHQPPAKSAGRRKFFIAITVVLVAGIVSVADVGISRAEATGTVSNLTQLADFNGNYVAVTAGAAVGGGAGATTMRNQNGVVVDLLGTSQGVKFNLSVDGVKFTLKQ